LCGPDHAKSSYRDHDPNPEHDRDPELDPDHDPDHDRDPFEESP
jgi:hypothetical protein